MGLFCYFLFFLFSIYSRFLVFFYYVFVGRRFCLLDLALGLFWYCSCWCQGFLLLRQRVGKVGRVESRVEGMVEGMEQWEGGDLQEFIIVYLLSLVLHFAYICLVHLLSHYLYLYALVLCFDTTLSDCSFPSLLICITSWQLKAILPITWCQHSTIHRNIHFFPHVSSSKFLLLFSDHIRLLWGRYITMGKGSYFGWVTKLFDFRVAAHITR